MIDEDIEGAWPKARWQWLETVSDIYCEGFFGGVSRWLEKRGMYCISNLWEEGLFWQAYTVGDFFKAQRSVTMPGNDCLVRKALQVHDFKETQSVTEFEGRRFQSEVLGVAEWYMSPVLMKQTVNCVTAWGVSHIVPHGIYLNRKLDTIPFPPDWFTSNPYWPYVHLWTDFARRASYVNSHGHTVPDVLLLNPMDSIWALIDGGVYDFKSPAGAWSYYRTLCRRGDMLEEIDKVYSVAINDLTNARVEFLIADRHYIRQMQVRPKGLLVREPFEFKALIMPPMLILPLDVAQKIVDFARAGGYVYLLRQLPAGSPENGLNDPKIKTLMDQLISLPTVRDSAGGIPPLVREGVPFLKPPCEFVSGKFDMIQLHRRIDNRDFFWLVNNGNKQKSFTMKFHNIGGRASVWNCETGQITDIPSKPLDDAGLVSLVLKPCQAYWLVFDPKREPLKWRKPVEPEWENLAELHQPWNIRIDLSAQPVAVAPRLIAPDELVDGQGDDKMLDSWLNWGLDQFSGYVDYRTAFVCDANDGRIILDLGEVKHMAEVWLNGQHVGARLCPPFEFDISGLVRRGGNELHIRVGNLIANAMRQFAPTLEAKSGSVWRSRAPTEQDFDAGLFGPVRVKKNLRSGR